jgi:hypothetical protein
MLRQKDAELEQRAALLMKTKVEARVELRATTGQTAAAALSEPLRQPLRPPASCLHCRAPLSSCRRNWPGPGRRQTAGAKWAVLRSSANINHSRPCPACAKLEPPSPQPLPAHPLPPPSQPTFPLSGPQAAERQGGQLADAQRQVQVLEQELEGKTHESSTLLADTLTLKACHPAPALLCQPGSQGLVACDLLCPPCPVLAHKL